MIFNTSGDRDPQVLLTPFLSSHLDLVIFTTNLSGRQGAVDQENFTTTDKIQLDRLYSCFFCGEGGILEWHFFGDVKYFFWLVGEFTY